MSGIDFESMSRADQIAALYNIANDFAGVADWFPTDLKTQRDKTRKRISAKKLRYLKGLIQDIESDWLQKMGNMIDCMLEGAKDD